MGFWNSGQQSEAAVEQWAARNGWGVSRNVSLPFEVGGPDDGQGQAEFMLHTFVDGRPVAVADYIYRRWHNSWDSDAANRRQMVRRTVTTVRLSRPYPRMSVKVRTDGGGWGVFNSVMGQIGRASDPVGSVLGDLQRKLLGPNTVKTEIGYPPFDEKFEIQATDQDLARRLIGQVLVEEHVSGRVPTWTVVGHDLYTLFGSNPIVVDEIPGRLSSLLRVAELLGG